METTTAIILAFNRCVEMSSTNLGYRLFNGNRTWLWLVLPMLFSVVNVMYTQTIKYSGIYAAWFFNPFIGYAEDTKGIVSKCK